MNTQKVLENVYLSVWANLVNKQILEEGLGIQSIDLSDQLN